MDTVPEHVDIPLRSHRRYSLSALIDAGCSVGSADCLNRQNLPFIFSVSSLCHNRDWNILGGNFQNSWTPTISQIHTTSHLCFCTSILFYLFTRSTAFRFGCISSVQFSPLTHQYTSCPNYARLLIRFDITTSSLKSFYRVKNSLSMKIASS